MRERGWDWVRRAYGTLIAGGMDLRVVMTAVLVLSLFLMNACAPEVGSKEWCEEMKKKPKGDWSTNNAIDFTKHCVMSDGKK